MLGCAIPLYSEGPLSNSNPPRAKPCAQPPAIECDSRTSTSRPYFASIAAHESPPTPEPITTTSTSWSPFASSAERTAARDDVGGLAETQGLVLPVAMPRAPNSPMRAAILKTMPSTSTSSKMPKLVGEWGADYQGTGARHGRHGPGQGAAL